MYRSVIFHDTLFEMANVRTCVLFFVLLVNYRLVASQPTFGTTLWCNMFCGDTDDSSDDESNDYSFLDLFDICYGCSSKSSSSSTATTTEKPAQQPVKVMIPPSTGLNLTVFSTIGGVLMDLVPWMASPTTAAPATTAAATTAAPASTTPAGSTAATTAAASTTAKA